MLSDKFGKKYTFTLKRNMAAKKGFLELWESSN